MQNFLQENFRNFPDSRLQTEKQSRISRNVSEIIIFLERGITGVTNAKTPVSPYLSRWRAFPLFSCCRHSGRPQCAPTLRNVLSRFGTPIFREWLYCIGSLSIEKKLKNVNTPLGNLIDRLWRVWISCLCDDFHQQSWTLSNPRLNNTKNIKQHWHH